MQNKKIILGICGGIAAYKTVELVSQLKKQGADVFVVMTKNAAKFVSAFSLQVMSGNKVYSQENLANEDEIDHIALADKADLVLIASATANSIAKMVTGISDEMLYDVVLATKAPVLIAPAMNTNMWEHPVTKRNMVIVKESLGYNIVEPESGTLACGHIGQGRLAEIDAIINRTAEILKVSIKKNSPTDFEQELKIEKPITESPKIEFQEPAEKKTPISSQVLDLDESEEELAPIEGLRNKKIVITVGPTREKIDPVRFITNKSSGKMGLCLAKEALRQGASVSLISTIDVVEPWVKNLKLIRVESCEEMYNAVFGEFAKSNLFSTPADALIMVAAVSDYRPRNPSDQKLKKSNLDPGSTINTIVNMINQANDKIGDLNIDFEKTPDILREVSKVKQANQIVIGFSVETENAIENARTKIKEKDLDFIVVNNPEAFGTEHAEVSVIGSEKQSAVLPLITTLPRQSKQQIAHYVLKSLVKCIQNTKHLAVEL